MIGGHVEGPPVVRHLETGCIAGHQERGDAERLTGFPGGAGEHQIVSCPVHAGVPAFGAVDHPRVAVEACGGLQPGGITAVVGFGEAEGHRPLTGEHGLNPLGLLLLGAEPVHHDDLREVTDDGRLVLQIVVQAEALVRQVFPDHRHVQVGAVATAEFRR